MKTDQVPDPDLPSLSNAEWEIMKLFWEAGEMAARDVYAALPDGHGWAYKTVKTMLSRLVAKGALEYQQVGNSYLYRPAHSRDRMTREAVRGFAARVMDGVLASVVAGFIAEGDLSPEEIERLQAALEEKARRPARRKRGAQ